MTDFTITLSNGSVIAFLPVVDPEEILSGCHNDYFDENIGDVMDFHGQNQRSSINPSKGIASGLSSF